MGWLIVWIATMLMHTGYVTCSTPLTDEELWELYGPESPAATSTMTPKEEYLRKKYNF